MREMLDRLAMRRVEALHAGDEKRIATRRAACGLTARERIELLFDPGSFKEFDVFAEHRAGDAGASDQTIPGDGVITGRGAVNGRAVLVFAQDSTVFGRAFWQAQAQKIVKLQDMALRTRAPIVGIFDAGGASIQEGVEALGGHGEIFRRNVAASGVIPQISLIMGPCAGAEVFSPALTDFIFMVRNASSLFVSGSQVLRTVADETVTVEDLGGARVHTTQSSVADGAWENDVEALLQVRRLLDFLPANNTAGAPHWPCVDALDRADHALDTLVPGGTNQAYDMKELVLRVADDGDFFELQERFAGNILTGFMRIDGSPVGVVANQPLVFAGVLDAGASRKAARFVRFCDCFEIPIVTFVDVPGFLPGIAQEHGGAIKHAAKLLYAYAEATAPLITVVTRNALGAAYALMASKHIGADLNYAWPSAQIAAIGAKGAVEILFRRDPGEAALTAARVKAYQEQIMAPFVAAGLGYIDEVIMPHETRSRIARGLALLATKKAERTWRKHDNIPL